MNFNYFSLVPFMGLDRAVAKMSSTIAGERLSSGKAALTELVMLVVLSEPILRQNSRASIQVGRSLLGSSSSTVLALLVSAEPPSVRRSK